MKTYERIMRLIRLQTRMDRHGWKQFSSSGYSASCVHFDRANRVHDTICRLVLRLTNDVNTLNTALRDQEES